MICDFFNMRRSPGEGIAERSLCIGRGGDDRPADKRSGRWGGVEFFGAVVGVILLAGCAGAPGHSRGGGGGGGLVSGFAAEERESAERTTAERSTVYSSGREPVRFQARVEEPDEILSREISEKVSAMNVNAQPSNVARTSDIKHGPELELEPESGPQKPAAPPPPMPPRDPGADLIMKDLARSIDAPEMVANANRGADLEAPIVIRLIDLRNMGRTTRREFDLFQNRLVGLLDRSGAEYGLSIVREVEDGVQVEANYELRGSAYLITREGIDQWELYLHLNRAGERWLILSPRDPVCVLREVNESRPQIVAGTGR